ncbi:SAM-dependent methyltransferase [Nonomuraea sp. NPDC003804]|uniref:SAM-dependent methyltransferase n=1 Tax=Nonomuraea sp. NPDC003804 TaxID=3154547 RepID=UPI0033AA848B
MDEAPPGINPHIPSVARMYDYYLGGKDNFRADREAAEKVLAVVPETRQAARENRAFMQRAVRFLAGRGIRQFLDIGTGLPTQGNVHEVAGPDARVVYVDNDPIVLTHARAILSGAEGVDVAQGDLRLPEAVLDSPEARRLLDFDEPVAILVVAVLHFVQDTDDPERIIGRLKERMAPGSYLVLSHACPNRPVESEDIASVYDLATAGIRLRDRAEVTPFFDGLELVEPGLVNVAEWRPEVAELAPLQGVGDYLLGGVGRKG